MAFFTFFRRMDWALNGCVAFLGAAGLVTIASVSPRELPQQVIAFGIGIALMLVFAVIDWRPLTVHRGIVLTVYGMGIALLVATYFFAPTIRSTRSWLVFGPFQFQASEFIKVALILLYSYYFARRHVGIAEWKNVLIPFAYAAVPIGLILLQPDMGSALIVLGVCVSYLFVSGIRWRHILIGIVLTAAIGFFGWNYLAQYQRERVHGLFNPRYDPLGVNYNVIQSKIAIGSGGLLGKGWRQGTQAQLGFLPEAANDFVFSAIAEEWGILGVLGVLIAYLMCIFRMIRIGVAAEGNFGKLVCLGVACLFLLHITLNIGSAIGFLPVVGVPMPLVSYGGSSVLTFFMALGIVQSIAIRSVF